MKYIPLFLFIFLVACKKETKQTYKTTQAYNLKNVHYGSSNEQVMDIYLPKNRTTSTKVIFLIHGGGWSSGSKSDLSNAMDFYKSTYPDYAVVNFEYRLATNNSPAYEKQIEDIKLAIGELQKEKYTLSKNYCFSGVSAGAHLSMLYAYKYDHNKQVKCVINTVGPVDFNDSTFRATPLFYGFMNVLLGTFSITNQSLYNEVSPINYIESNSAKTISFYGTQDPLVPLTQAGIITNKLAEKNVVHETIIYEAGHGNWNATDMTDYVTKTLNFINNEF